MASKVVLPKWASKPCMMGIDEAGRGPVLGLFLFHILNFSLYAFIFLITYFGNCLRSHGLCLLVLCFLLHENPSYLEFCGNKINLNEISHESAMGLIDRVLKMGVLLTEVYIDTVGDAGKYEMKLSKIFPSIKFVVAKKADSLYPVVSGASIVAKVTRDRALKEWVLDETAENMHRNFGSGYPGDPQTKSWLEHHRHTIFGFPTLVRFSWGTCNTYFKDIAEVLWESDNLDEDGCSTNNNGKRQLKLSNMGFTTSKRSEEIESSGKGRSRFFQARKLEHLSSF
ncbi:ribonuclease H2 subunit A isoform X2 [Abrus precatorius]|uniref:Ribonuclease n=1 Tax=Abrus precatorius TaxID=3816 RepID=A0A8B8MGE6_ABRPR|nr:ribonuclease H2 subunit A isoform X2 [Abrus precatorius]